LSALRARLTPLLARGHAPVIAELDRSYLLTADTQQRLHEDVAPRLTLEAVSKLDWHNLRADFLAALNDALEHAPTDEARETMLQNLRNSIPN
jgi:metallo-beta-lactamase family protein